MTHDEPEIAKRRQALDESNITDAWLESTIAEARGTVEQAHKAGEADGVEVRCANEDCSMGYTDHICAFGKWPRQCLKAAMETGSWYEGVVSLRRELRIEKIATRKVAYAALVESL